MELKKFEGMNKNELSMIEVSREILHEENKPMAFADLTNAVQKFLGKSDEEIRERLPQFYTDLNIDGSFISLGGNTWALRSWYPYESIDEALVHSEEEEQQQKRQKVNAFLDTTSDDDVIDYDTDDMDDDDFDDENEHQQLKDYQSNLDEIDDENEPKDDLPDGIEGQLNEFSSHDDD